MADINNGRKTFKWGDQEYLLDDLLKLHGEYEQNFYDFARDRGQYDSTALQGLQKAIATRINAAKEGKTFDGDGVLDTDEVDNTRITTQKKGVFKKEKYVDQDNTAWAKHYMNRLMGKLKPYKKETSSSDNGAWNISKHGLEAYLTGQGLNAQDIFERYDLRDQDNPDNPRSFKQRRDLLKRHLAEYKAWLDKKGFDFTSNDNEWDDNFATDFYKFMQDYDSLDNNALAAALRKFGAGSDYTIAFTSDKWDLSKNNEESKKESEEALSAKRAKQEAEHLRLWEDYAHSQKGNGLKATQYAPYAYSGNYQSFEDWYGDLNKNQQQQYGTYLGKDAVLWDKHWKNLTESLRSNKAYTDKNAGVLLQGTFETQPQLFTDLGNGKYLINQSISDSGQGYTYNPTTGYVESVFIGDLAANNDDIKKEYKRLAYKWLNTNHGTNYEDRTYVFAKDGGELVQTFQLGGTANFSWGLNDDNKLKEKADKTGLTPEQQKDRDRYINSNNKSLNNPDAGFSGSEIARLVSIGADLTSLVLDPITGTAVGLGSTATNFIADITDDGFQWEDVKNLGINVGFDLLGAIPVFGDAVGTGGKIIKNLAKFGPRIMAGLAAYQGVKNFNGMMGSWDKMLSSDDASKMTVQDWRNIAQSISLITGAGRAIKNKAAQQTMKNKAKVDDVIGVNVYDKTTNQVKQLLIDGDAAKRIREAKGVKSAVEAELAKLEPFKDKFGENGTFEVMTKGRGPWQTPLHRVDDGTSKHFEWRGWRKDGIAQVNNVYDFSRVPEGYGAFFGKQSNWGKKVGSWHTSQMEALNKRITPTQENHKGALTTAEVDAQVKSFRDPVDAQIEKVKTAMESRNRGLESLEAEVKTTTKQIKDLQTKLRDIKKADVKNELVGLHGSTKGLKTVEIELQKANERVTNLENQLKAVDTQIQNRGNQGNKPSSRLQQTKAKLESEIQIGKAQITAMEAKVQTLRDAGQTRQTRETELKGTLKDFEDLRILQKRLNNLHKNQSLAEPTTHTREYNKLQQMLSDLQTNRANIGGRDVNWDMTEILRQANLSNAFKQGGQINRNKINKFLNYGKG